ncbi:hypothetical protein IQ243_29065 [Nostocales cyanobacterium LEGE 11386]|nr:hypothetical protein [Nostocales cyanobacterium LEGE 11386]
MRCDSSTQHENTHCEETAIAPLGGASPQIVESVEEEKELPTACDCTSLKLVDAVQGQSTLLIREKLDCSVEPKDCHEDAISAAPITQHEEKAQFSLSTSLTGENKISGGEDKTHHDNLSAAPAPNDEKWSYEAVVERSKARPWRMEKLKMAGILEEKPDFSFLVECWEDDPALRIVIKGLVKKFPQWGLVAVDGVLMKWDE